MNTIVLIEIGKILIPIIQIFGIYVIFFGHLSPGGGFAGGTIIGTSLILYRIIFGNKKAAKKLGFKRLMRLTCGSLIFYGVLKGYSFITGGAHIHAPQISLGSPGSILSGGYILPLNIAVGIVVAITIYFLFCLFYEGEI
ncbi:MnhB domain-containing protein [Paramaledivibacter caminithermalis]|jgi:multicomponent Na+:H+ antiporter subunit B|uniref:Multisubunit sodium/proton antiporter, MrpB subunit n=1 Tax=Paramaledivibacter caminithermalis (strain DSM 15212 / CIP 107654 / DViRD3) TaxID=1121301 RepID=A0A1M6NZ87_PARC5|nr:MnhB domain-containing protein [Paramaledivibacter caminithermalis]SHK00981.1 multisubunit sodium/proton antiporter, MrpB subunit [Paramaledivibacter caminithermalis DSM 15212]